MNQEVIQNKNIVSIIAILALLLAIPSGIWPYGYYVLLRWVITGVALFVLSIANKLQKEEWVKLMAGIAILFNPILPIHLDKETWVIIDFIVAILFFASIFQVKPEDK